MTARAGADRLVPRYLPAQRALHWVGAACFLSLLFSGLTLAVTALAPLAAGGALRLIHRLAAIPFMALPLTYAALLPRQAKELLRESLSYDASDRAWLRSMPRYLFGQARGLPPQGRLNAGQKLHHAATFLLFVTISASGLVLWLGKSQLGPVGLSVAAAVHDLSMLGLTVLLIGHVYFTFLYGALPAMLTGSVSEEYARLEHARWLESLGREGAHQED